MKIQNVQSLGKKFNYFIIILANNFIPGNYSWASMSHKRIIVSKTCMQTLMAD